MMLKLAAAVLALPVAAVAGVAATGVVVVDVHERQGHHIIVPVPLLAVRAAAAFVPDAHPRMHLDDAAKHIPPVARAVLQALADAPDGELVRVEERNEQVVITKRGDVLEIRVHGDDEVSVNVPLAMALQMLPDQWNKLSPRAAVGALAYARYTDLVDVQSANGDHVKVSIW